MSPIQMEPPQRTSLTILTPVSTEENHKAVNFFIDIHGKTYIDNLVTVTNKVVVAEQVYYSKGTYKTMHTKHDEQAILLGHTRDLILLLCQRLKRCNSYEFNGITPEIKIHLAEVIKN